MGDWHGGEAVVITSSDVICRRNRRTKAIKQGGGLPPVTVKELSCTVGTAFKELGCEERFKISKNISYKIKFNNICYEDSGYFL